MQSVIGAEVPTSLLPGYEGKENKIDDGQSKPAIVNCVCLQSKEEEVANAVSHGAGALLAIAATVLMIVRAAVYGTGLHVFSVSFYGASLIVLYSASCLYHFLTAPKAKRVFQVFDHCSIFLLILGTYVPLALVSIGGALGWTIFGINTFCTVVGITLNSVDLARWHKLSLVLYLIMGWLVVIAVRPLLAALPVSGICFLVAGGLAYTIGIVFYKAKSPAYMHFIWHLFVLAGSILQFFTVYNCCCGK